MAYTNSPLVTYTNLTKNKTTNRKQAIDTITIHCIVAQWTAKQGCDYFATTDRQCSANYVVGKDGSIGLSVEEKDRSWCTSSSANDNRAITIEVASDTKHPYAVTDAAYSALLDLVTDICKRNGIKKLVWSENKDDRKNHLNGCNMTVHRDYANKSCPGEYLYSRHGEIAEIVNKRLNTEPDFWEDDEFYYWKKGTVKQLSANFKTSEFECKCKGYCDECKISKKLIDLLQNIRSHFNKSTNVNSGFRCELHNKNVGGSANSNHKKGCAADIRVSGIEPRTVAQYAEKLGIKGIGLYETDKDGYFVHIDTRAKKSFWYGQACERRETFLPIPLTGTASTGSAVDEKKIWDFLKSKIGNEFGVSGLMGNLNAESALRSNNLQQTFEKKLGFTDKTYTESVDNGTYTNFVKDGSGYGLAQWTYWTRKQKLLDFARTQKKSIGDLQMQLEFLYKELSENFNKSVLQKLKTAKSVREASDVVLKVYESPADQSEKVQEKRASYGEKYFKKYSTKTEIKPETKPETKPVATTTTCNDFKIGEIVEFTGDTHYISASSKTGQKTVTGLAKVTAVYKNGTHQLHLRAINKNGKFVSGVYGWVDVSDVKKIENRTPQIGDIVNFTGNTHYISSTSKIGKPTKPSRAKITAINKAGSHKYHLRAINDAGKYVGGGVYGWVNEDDIELI